MRGGVDLRLMARRLPVERGRPLTEAEAEADGRLVGSLLLGVRQRGRREQKERNRDRVETDRHSRSYPPSIGTVRVIGRTAGNRFRSPADLSEHPALRIALQAAYLGRPSLLCSYGPRSGRRRSLLTAGPASLRKSRITAGPP